MKDGVIYFKNTSEQPKREEIKRKLKQELKIEKKYKKGRKRYLLYTG